MGTDEESRWAEILRMRTAAHKNRRKMLEPDAPPIDLPQRKGTSVHVVIGGMFVGSGAYPRPPIDSPLHRSPAWGGASVHA